MICEGSSTKSCFTFVPLSERYSPCAKMPWSECPNSWRKVVTSSKVSSEGFVSVGLVKFITSDTSGRTSRSPTRYVPRNSVIQAPARFEGRGKKSR